MYAIATIIDFDKKRNQYLAYTDSGILDPKVDHHFVWIEPNNMNGAKIRDNVFIYFNLRRMMAKVIPVDKIKNVELE